MARLPASRTARTSMPSTCSPGMLNDTPRFEKSVWAEARRDRGAHGVAVVLDHVDDRQLPQLRHVEALVDLALVRGAVAEIGERDAPVLAVPVGEAEPGAERDLRADDAVAAVEVLLLGEHVHRAALALGVAAAASGELGHHPLRIHAADQHVPVITVSRDHLIALLRGHLHADDDGLLADVEMAEAADQAHAVHLAGLLLEAADEQHLAIGVELLVLGELRAGLAGLILGSAFRGAAGTAGSKGHRCLRTVLASLLTQRGVESESPKSRVGPRTSSVSY